MKIYTRTGDEGDTGLFGGPRVRKDDLRIESYGTVDELNAWLGLVRTELADPRLDSELARVQHELFDLGAELATPDPAAFHLRLVGEADIARLEAQIDQAEQELQPLKQFILPGGTRAASLLHLARTVCRRAERRLVSLTAEPDTTVAPQLVVYLNRLSDWLFVAARLANARAGQAEAPWCKRGERGE